MSDEQLPVCPNCRFPAGCIAHGSCRLEFERSEHQAKASGSTAALLTVPELPIVAWRVSRDSCDTDEFFETKDEAQVNAALGIASTYIRPLTDHTAATAALAHAQNIAMTLQLKLGKAESRAPSGDAPPLSEECKRLFKQALYEVREGGYCPSRDERVAQAAAVKKVDAAIDKLAALQPAVQGEPTRGNRDYCCSRFPFCGCGGPDPQLVVPLDAPNSGSGDLAASSLRETAACLDVLAERRRQIEVEGWTAEHDDEHDAAQLAFAAACYAIGHMDSRLWPWGEKWWKSSDTRRNLVKAGALILAEIERLDRAAISQGEPKP